SGMAALDDLIPIAFVVVILLAIVAFSYRQTIFAYPSGGGSYVVSRESLGVNPSLVAGASLLTDYILTVSVSVAAGVAAITSAFRRPESKNAAATLMWMAAILGTFFFGISVLAHRLAPTLQHEGGETILSLLGRAVFGHNSPMYFVLQVSTAAILTLAANTAY